MSIFVSHSQQDEAVYSNFCLALDGSGVKRWDPQKMAVGQSLADQLREAIRICDACVFLATKRSVESKWCMAELGAFWGAGKRVIVFLADPDITEAHLPIQFQGNLWSRDARRVLEAIQDLSATVPYDILTPDLVLLLRYLERDDRWILPDFYGKGLAVANGVPNEAEDAALQGWKRAVRYGLLYLAQHGLTRKQSDTSVTYSISQHGKDVLNSPRVRERFRESFEKLLLPLSAPARSVSSEVKRAILDEPAIEHLVSSHHVDEGRLITTITNATTFEDAYRSVVSLGKNFPCRGNATKPECLKAFNKVRDLLKCDPLS